VRQVRHGGEKLFADCVDKKQSIIEAVTVDVIEVELFVAVLDALRISIEAGTPRLFVQRLSHAACRFSRFVETRCVFSAFPADIL